MPNRTLIAAAMLALVVDAHSQEQEQGLWDRITAQSRDSATINPMQERQFVNTGVFRSEGYDTGAYAGTKAAPTSEFATRSFLGIKNPWFGEKVFETGEASGQKAFADAAREFSSDEFQTSDFEPGKRSAGYDDQPTNETFNRTTSVEPQSQGGLDEFTRNLSSDLTIDQVRALLNKGQDNN